MNKLSVEEIQKAELNILINVDNICKEMGLRYYLIYGTLLGAVRHHGFIPWDDDLDIMMPREDYTKLIDYFENNKDSLFPLKTVYVWHEYQYSYAMTRITDMNYKLDFTNEDPFCEEDMGIFIDIYPYDGVGNNPKEAMHMSKQSRSILTLINRATLKEPYHDGSKVNRELRSIAYKFAKKKGKGYYHNKMLKLTNKYQYDTSKYVSCLTWHSASFFLARRCFEPAKSVEFCGRCFDAPNDCDYFLSNIYGDYMTLPPKEKRHPSHNYDAYIRNDFARTER